MATSPLSRVPSTSIDVDGVSVSTATPSALDPRAGTAFNLTDFAVAQPVWFHPLTDGRYLLLASRRWYNATPDGGNPGLFTAHSEATTPSWILLDGPSGQRSPVSGSPITVPMNIAVSSRVLTAAASRPSDQLYLLNAVVIDGDPAAVVQRFHVLSPGTVTLSAEEVLPAVAGVVFSKGLQLVPTMPWLVVYGSDSTGLVYRIRKPWAHIGVNRRGSNEGFSTVVGTPQGWEYWTGSGYSLDPTEVGPVAGVQTAGPMSFASQGSTVLMTTVDHAGGLYTGRTWTSVVGLPFRKTTATVALGGSTTYLGGGIQLMPMLRDGTGGVLSIPYCTSVKAISGGESGIVNTWGLWPWV